MISVKYLQKALNINIINEYSNTISQSESCYKVEKVEQMEVDVVSEVGISGSIM